eukprot:2839332-Amphidinium_carterae.2
MTLVFHAKATFHCTSIEEVNSTNCLVLGSQKRVNLRVPVGCQCQTIVIMTRLSASQALPDASFVGPAYELPPCEDSPHCHCKVKNGGFVLLPTLCGSTLDCHDQLSKQVSHACFRRPVVNHLQSEQK